MGTSHAQHQSRRSCTKFDTSPASSVRYDKRSAAKNRGEKHNAAASFPAYCTCSERKTPHSLLSVATAFEDRPAPSPMPSSKVSAAPWTYASHGRKNAVCSGLDEISRADRPHCVFNGRLLPDIDDEMNPAHDRRSLTERDSSWPPPKVGDACQVKASQTEYRYRRAGIPTGCLGCTFM